MSWLTWLPERPGPNDDQRRGDTQQRIATGTWLVVVAVTVGLGGWCGYMAVNRSDFVYWLGLAAATAWGLAGLVVLVDRLARPSSQRRAHRRARS